MFFANLDTITILASNYSSDEFYYANELFLSAESFIDI